MSRIIWGFEKAITICLLILMLTVCGRRSPEHQVITPHGDILYIPLKSVDDGKVHFFTYRHAGRNINFFVRTDGSGQLQTHFDACYSCFKYKLGYVWEGNQVVCIACRVGYNLEDEVWDYVGACIPIKLHSSIVGDFLAIKQYWLEKGGKFF